MTKNTVDRAAEGAQKAASHTAQGIEHALAALSKAQDQAADVLAHLHDIHSDIGPAVHLLGWIRSAVHELEVAKVQARPMAPEQTKGSPQRPRPAATHRRPAPPAYRRIFEAALWVRESYREIDIPEPPAVPEEVNNALCYLSAVVDCDDGDCFCGKGDYFDDLVGGDEQRAQLAAAVKRWEGGAA